jgi:uncharacterized protein
MAPTKLCFAGSQNPRSEFKSRPREFAAYAFLINNLWKATGKTLGHYWERTMTLSEQIQKDIVTAMKAKDELRLSVLRMVKSALQLKEVEKIRALDSGEFIQLLQTLAKQRKESIEQFQKGGRQDLVEKETQELAVLESYLPAGASAEEMDTAITKAIAGTGATSPKQMGAVVKAAKEALAGKTVDGKALSDRVRDRLSGLA